MILTREQIERMYTAAQANGASHFYAEEDADGKLRFGAIQMIEKRKTLPLTGKKT